MISTHGEMIMISLTVLSLLFFLIRFLFDYFDWWPRKKEPEKIPQEGEQKQQLH